MEGTHLQQYAMRLQATEINSSFYRAHKRETYAKWASSVGEHFRFSVKIPKTITHERRLVDSIDLLEQFLNEVAGLGDKLGCLLVQLPPSLTYDEPIAKTFLVGLRSHYQGAIALEPRHRSWFSKSAETLLVEQRVTRAAADPAVVENADVPGGDTQTIYYRLHGSPRTYYSAYSPEFLQNIERQIRDWLTGGAAIWCIFDNTASGAASLDALQLQQMLSRNSLGDFAQFS